MDDGLVRLFLTLTVRSILNCLNPCCSGRWSSTGKEHIEFALLQWVLILVVVDDGLVLRQANLINNLIAVLILVVVDDGLVPLVYMISKLKSLCLNPCCSGRWSSTRPYKTILIINKLKNLSKQIFTFINRKLTIS